MATRFFEPNTAPPPPRPSARPLSFMIAPMSASRRPAAPTVITRAPAPYRASSTSVDSFHIVEIGFWRRVEPHAVGVDEEHDRGGAERPVRIMASWPVRR